MKKSILYTLLLYSLTTCNVSNSSGLHNKTCDVSNITSKVNDNNKEFNYRIQELSNKYNEEINIIKMEKIKKDFFELVKYNNLLKEEYQIDQFFINKIIFPKILYTISKTKYEKPIIIGNISEQLWHYIREYFLYQQKDLEEVLHKYDYLNSNKSYDYLLYLDIYRDDLEGLQINFNDDFQQNENNDTTCVNEQLDSNIKQENNQENNNEIVNNSNFLQEKNKDTTDVNEQLDSNIKQENNQENNDEIVNNSNFLQEKNKDTTCITEQINNNIKQENDDELTNNDLNKSFILDDNEKSSQILNNSSVLLIGNINNASKIEDESSSQINNNLISNNNYIFQNNNFIQDNALNALYFLRFSNKRLSLIKISEGYKLQKHNDPYYYLFFRDIKKKVSNGDSNNLSEKITIGNKIFGENLVLRAIRNMSILQFIDIDLCNLFKKDLYCMFLENLEYDLTARKEEIYKIMPRILSYSFKEFGSKYTWKDIILRQLLHTPNYKFSIFIDDITNNNYYNDDMFYDKNKNILYLYKLHPRYFNLVLKAKQNESDKSVLDFSIEEPIDDNKIINKIAKKRERTQEEINETVSNAFVEYGPKYFINNFLGKVINKIYSIKNLNEYKKVCTITPYSYQAIQDSSFDGFTYINTENELLTFNIKFNKNENDDYDVLVKNITKNDISQEHKQFINNLPENENGKSVLSLKNTQCEAILNKYGIVNVYEERLSNIVRKYLNKVSTKNFINDLDWILSGNMVFVNTIDYKIAKRLFDAKYNHENLLLGPNIKQMNDNIYLDGNKYDILMSYRTIHKGELYKMVFSFKYNDVLDNQLFSIMQHIFPNYLLQTNITQNNINNNQITIDNLSKQEAISNISEQKDMISINNISKYEYTNNNKINIDNILQYQSLDNNQIEITEEQKKFAKDWCSNICNSLHNSINEKLINNKNLLYKFTNIVYSLQDINKNEIKYKLLSLIEMALDTWESELKQDITISLNKKKNNINDNTDNKDMKIDKEEIIPLDKEENNITNSMGYKDVKIDKENTMVLVKEEDNINENKENVNIEIKEISEISKDKNVTENKVIDEIENRKANVNNNNQNNKANKNNGKNDMEIKENSNTSELYLKLISNYLDFLQNNNLKVKIKIQKEFLERLERVYGDNKHIDENNIAYSLYNRIENIINNQKQDSKQSKDNKKFMKA